jgi:hypothetical protein
VHLFCEDAQRCLAGNEVNFGDARIGVQRTQHLGGKDGAAGSGDGESEAEIGGRGFGWRGHEAIIADMSRLCDAAGENRQRQRLEICVKKIPDGCGWASFVGILPLHFVQGQDDSKNKQPRRANTEILATPE